LVASGSPKETLRQAYALGWIHEEKVWLDMLDDRNLSTHAYDEKIAARIAADLPAYYPILQGVMDLLRSKYPEF
jgi:nucleotidyltransferase substrate binding protein (TIGR01987 family)